jgi:hypothetical protein
MTRGQLIAVGIGAGLVVGVLTGWVIGGTVGITALANSVKRLQDDRDETAKKLKAEEDAKARALADVKKEADTAGKNLHDSERELLNLTVRRLEDSETQLKKLQKCAAIRVDVKKEKDLAVFYIGGQKVDIENMQKTLQDLVTWDGKPDLIIVRHDKDLVGDAATVEDEAKKTKKYGNAYNLEELPSP